MNEARSELLPWLWWIKTMRVWDHKLTGNLENKTI